MRHRPSCNRIMGCPGKVALMQEGRAVVPLLVARVRGASRADDGYWLTAIIDLLGQLGDERARPLLETLLEDSRWELPIRAAQALGRLGPGPSRALLEDTLRRAQEVHHAALVGALHLALTRLPGDAGRAHRDALVVMLPQTYEGLAAIPPIVLDLLVEFVREARLPKALPAVRLLIRHDNRFVRAQSLETAAALRDTGALPYAYDRLEDPIPSVRKRALEALQTITGAHRLSDPDAWKQWCAQHGCDALPEGSPPPPGLGLPRAGEGEGPPG
ncbi:MAG: HEAT repeat domain-containing protein [Deltaproteobacteria bacterium]|nr:HEAT repeat domain-containing protein [Deltaproteobacteria bacterium]